MEGIFGVLCSNGLFDTVVMQRMDRTLEELPQAKYVIDRQLSIGVKRLPCISHHQGTEPKWTKDNQLLCAINGEIINFDELKLALEQKGYHISNDNELVAYLYKEKGEDFLRELDGMFTIVIWDRKEKKLILAQDRYGGIRQIYYCQTTSNFMFATAIRPILATGMMEREVDNDALIDFFTTGYILPPHTMFSTVKKLMPGSILIWEKGSIVIKMVDVFQFSPVHSGDGYRLEDTFNRAVSKRLISDRSIGLFLSGGIDSSLTVATATKVSGSPLNTISLGFKGSPLDESYYANLVATHFGTQHMQFFLESGNSLDPLPTIIWHLEEPLSDFSVIPTYWLVKFAKEKVDVVLAGDGPDHLFGSFYYAPKWRSICRLIPGSRYLMSYLINRNLLSRSPIIRKAQVIAYVCNVNLERVCMLRYSFLGALNLLSNGMRVPVNNWSHDVEPQYSEEADEYAKLVACDFLTSGSFGVFTKLGKIAAGESLVVREPYFDRDVVDYINRLPQQLKAKGSIWQYLSGNVEYKYYLRHALANRILPEEVLLKRKGGFVPPLDEWLREKLQGQTIRKLLSSSVINSGYFDINYAEHILDQHQSGKRAHTAILFMLLVFDLWHRLYIDSFDEDRPTNALMDYYR